MPFREIREKRCNRAVEIALDETKDAVTRVRTDLRDPDAYAGACVTLLSPAGAVHRGTVWTPAPAENAA